MSLFQSFIDKHDRVKVLKMCIKNNGNEHFQKMILGKDPYTNTLIPRMNSEDSLIEKTIYCIKSGSESRGFFAQYRRVLNYLYYADAWGFIPYIEFDKSFPYSEEDEINGSNNPFEYYYKQPCIAKEELSLYRYIVNNRKCDLELSECLKPTNGYSFSEEYLNVMAELSKKYILYNDKVQDYLDSSVDMLLSNRCTLGVHVRLSDFKKNYFGHPVCVTADKHLECAKRAMNLGNYEQVFLATDDEDTVTLFREEFGDKVVYYSDVVRTKGDISVAFSESNREHHRYRLGLEVLRDMVTLSKCNGLIAGKSQVSICAMIENRKNEPYSYVEIIDLGYNTDINNSFRND